jgi:hypothetical protein
MNPMSLYLFLALLRTVSTVKTLSKSRGRFVSKLQCQNKKETLDLVHYSYVSLLYF